MSILILLENLLRLIQLKSQDQYLAKINEWKQQYKIEYDKQFAIQFKQLYFRLYFQGQNQRLVNKEMQELASLITHYDFIQHSEPIFQMMDKPSMTFFSLLFDYFKQNAIFNNYDHQKFESFFETYIGQPYQQDLLKRIYHLGMEELKGDENERTYKGKMDIIIQTLQRAKVLPNQDLNLIISQEPEAPINFILDEFLVNKFDTFCIKSSDKQKINAVVNSFVQLLQQIDFAKIGISVLDYQYFGSQLNGFGTIGSDVDFTLLTNSFVNERQLLGFIHHELQYNIQNKTTFKYNKIYDARVRIPLLGAKHIQSNFDIDLCINNILGAINTQLLYQYSQLHPKIQQAGVLLKLWAKHNKIISTQTLSSYAIILMLICFLQKKYHVPLLQDDAEDKRQTITVKRILRDNQPDGFKTNCFFIQNKQEIDRKMVFAKEKLDQTRLSTILIDFWKHYSQELEQRNFQVSIHAGNTERNKTIIDPIDHHHDPGEKLFNGVNKALIIRQKFIQASQSSMKDWQTLFN